MKCWRCVLTVTVRPLSCFSFAWKWSYRDGQNWPKPPEKSRNVDISEKMWNFSVWNSEHVLLKAVGHTHSSSLHNRRLPSKSSTCDNEIVVNAHNSQEMNAECTYLSPKFGCSCRLHLGKDVVPGTQRMAQKHCGRAASVSFFSPTVPAKQDGCVINTGAWQSFSGC